MKQIGDFTAQEVIDILSLINEYEKEINFKEVVLEEKENDLIEDIFRFNISRRIESLANRIKNKAEIEDPDQLNNFINELKGYFRNYFKNDFDKFEKVTYSSANHNLIYSDDDPILKRIEKIESVEFIGYKIAIQPNSVYMNVLFAFASSYDKEIFEIKTDFNEARIHKCNYELFGFDRFSIIKNDLYILKKIKN